jgi:hypothetical protein
MKCSPGWLGDYEENDPHKNLHSQKESRQAISGLIMLNTSL